MVNTPGCPRPLASLLLLLRADPRRPPPPSSPPPADSAPADPDPLPGRLCTPSARLLPGGGRLQSRRLLHRRWTAPPRAPPLRQALAHRRPRPLLATCGSALPSPAASPWRVSAPGGTALARPTYHTTSGGPTPPLALPLSRTMAGGTLLTVVSDKQERDKGIGGSLLCAPEILHKKLLLVYFWLVSLIFHSITDRD